MEGPSKDEADLEQVFLGEKSFTFPSAQLGRLHDHTGMHRSRTCGWNIENFRFKRELYSDIDPFRAGDWDGLRKELSEKGKSFLFEQHNLMQWSMNNDWNDVNINKDLLWRKVLFQGYLFLRGLHQREDVLEARKGTKKKSVEVTICVLNIQKEPKQCSP